MPPETAFSEQTPPILRAKVPEVRASSAGVVPASAESRPLPPAPEILPFADSDSSIQIWMNLLSI